jgi:SRSO17 transposase
LRVGDDVCVAEVRAWADGLEEIRELIGPCFARSEPRDNAVDYLRGLLSGAERKNSWTLSEQAGQAVPDRMQRLLSTADWSPDSVRDDLRSYVLKHLGASDGVLIVDETGFLKKGNRSAGVARQYSGTAGRIENSQIGVFLTYSTTAGRTFLDRELYLPKVWTDDRERCEAAGIPTDRGFKTKPELAMDMLARALDAGVPARWVTGDAVYGQYYKLRKALEDRACSMSLWCR